MKNLFARLALAAILGSLLISIQPLLAQGTAFTYQGQLNAGGSPANGNYDFTFGLYKTNSTSGNQVGDTLTNLDVGVTNGLFTTTIDFGPGIFNGGALWLQSGVKTNGGSTFMALSPLQELTPTPYAITAENVSGSIPLAQLPATVGLLSDPGTLNFFAGLAAGNSAVSGVENTGIGYATLFENTAGSYNTATGGSALEFNTTGSFNSAFGYDTLLFNTTGSNNTGTGAYALSAYNVNGDVVGGGNTANGAYALASDETGYNNTSVGYLSLQNNTNGYDNVAVGVNALQVLNDGTYDIGNTALGALSCPALVSGYINTAVGDYSFYLLTNGYYNTAIGDYAGYHLTSGTGNLYLGNYGTQGDNNVTRIGEGQTETYISSWDGAFLEGALSLDGSDTNNGLVYTMASGLPGIDPGGNGVFLYGYNGGVLGCVGSNEASLSWDYDGNVWVSNNLSANTLTLRGGSGSALSVQGAMNADSINCSPGPLSFGSSTAQMLSLYSNSVTCYAIGIQNQDMYFRCGADVSGTGFAWYRGGQPNSSPFNAGGGSNLMTLTASGLTVSGTFVSSCDRNVKQDFAPVDCRTVLEKVAQLPEQTWAYKDDPGTKHLGPMAQDFYAAFGTGADDKHIAVVDEGGVALAAIQGLNQKLNEKDAEIQELKQSVVELKKMLQTLAEKK